MKKFFFLNIVFILSFCLISEEVNKNYLIDTATPNVQSDVKPSFLQFLTNQQKRSLFVKTEIIRYLNESNQTEFHLIYKIPNNELQFIQSSEGFVASLDIKIDILRDGTEVNSNRFDYLAGAQTVGIAQSDNHYILDKITFTISKEGFSVNLKIQDKNASTTFEQRYDLTLLESESLLSDIEVSHGVSTILSPSLEKFQRGEYQFYVDPIPVIDSNEKDFIIYYEVNNITKRDDGLYTFFDFIKIFKDDQMVYETEYSNTVEAIPHPLVRRIPIGDWDAGLYTILISITDPKAQKNYEKERNFSLFKRYILNTQRIFSNDDDEFTLISYFIDNKQKRLWRDLSDIGKKNYIERFWVANNPNPITNDNQFLQLIRTRVNEANWRFSSHRVGWKTDMGRIYIKYGSPDKIIKEETHHDSRYPRKPYQSWRYYGPDKTFVFLDFQGNGNSRLVYVKNEESETSDPGWRGYFGEGFSENKFDD